MYRKKNSVIDFRRNTKIIIMISTNENRNNRRTSISIPRLSFQTRRQNAIKQRQVSFFIKADCFLTVFSVTRMLLLIFGTGKKLELSSGKASHSLNIPLEHYHTTHVRDLFSIC